MSETDELNVRITDIGELQFGVGATENIATGIDYSTLLDGELHHLAVTWDNAVGSWSVYVDGEFVETSTGFNAGYIVKSGGELIIGQEQDSLGGGFVADQAFSGTLYDLRVWDDIRTPAEIKLNTGFTFDSPEQPSGLVANWQFDGFTNGEVIDSVSANNLTVGHATGGGYVASLPTDRLVVDENAANGSSIGFVVPTDPDHSAIIIEAILATDSSLTYDAITNEFYKTVTTRTQWGNARNIAASELLNGAAGQLVRIDSDHENDLIHRIVGEVGVLWLGASDLAVEGEWRWLDGVVDGDQFWSGNGSGSGINGAYENWLAGEPGNFANQEHVAVMKSDGSWHDDNPAEFLPYVIEWDANEVINSYTFSLIDTASGRFQLDRNTGELTVADGSQLNFEANTLHTVVVEVIDQEGLSFQESLQINVADLNEAPSLNVINLDVPRFSNSTSIRPSLAASDPDAADTDDQLTFTVTALPSLGEIRLSGALLGINDTFTYADVVADLVTYAHTGQAASVDSYELSFADGGENGTSPIAVVATIDLTNSPPTAIDDVFNVDEDGTLFTANDWFDLSWSSRQKLVFDNQGQTSDLIDFPVLVQLDASDFDYSKVQSNGEDLRFVDADGLTLLDYEIEEWDPIGESNIWVRVPQIDAGSDTDFIWMYFDNATAAAGENASAVWSSDFRLVHHLHDNLIDSTADNVDAQSANSANAEGVIGDGEQFDIGQIIDFGSPTSIDDIFDGGGTVSAWIRPNSLGESGFGRIFDKNTDIIPNPAGWDLSLRGSGPTAGLLFEFGYGDNHGEWFTSSDLITMGQWHHVALSFDSSNSSDPLFYVDGVQVPTTEGQTPRGIALSDAGQNLAAGNQPSTSNRAFDGVLDELRLESSIRSSDEITADVLTGTANFVTVELDGVLANDTDLDGNLLTTTLVSGTSHGALTLDPNGNFTYRPNADFNGTDSFTYEVSDGSDTDVANVTINVASINDAPVLTNPNSTLTVAEGFSETISIVGLAVSDDESPDSNLTWTITAQPNHGFVTMNGIDPVASFTQEDIVRGRVSYVHDGAEEFVDAVELEVTDGTLTTGNQRIDITILPVNDSPNLVVGDFGLLESGSFVLSRSQINAIDPDSLPSDINLFVDHPNHGRFERITSPGMSTTSFTQQDIDDGLIRYVHDGTHTAEDEFGVAASDNPIAISPPFGNPVRITVTLINDTPTTVMGTLTAEEGSSTTVTASELTVTDEESQAELLVWTVSRLPQHGFLSMDGTNSVTSFTQLDIQNGRLLYVHDSGEDQVDSVVFSVRDADGATVTEQAMSINIAPINDAPTLSMPTTQLVVMDTELEFTASTGTINIDDVDAGENFVEVTIVVTNGTVTLSNTSTITFLSGDGFEDTSFIARDSIGDINAALEGLTFKPTSGFTGTATVLVTVDDLGNTGPSNQVSSASTSITVAQQPDAKDDSYQVTISVDSALTGNVLGNDTFGEGTVVTPLSRPDGGVLSLLPGGTFVFLPYPGFVGETSFEYAVTSPEGLGDVASVVIDVTAALAPIVEPTPESPSLTPTDPTTDSNPEDENSTSTTSSFVGGPAQAVIEKRNLPTKARKAPQASVPDELTDEIVISINERISEATAREGSSARRQNTPTEGRSSLASQRLDFMVAAAARYDLDELVFQDMETLNQSILANNNWTVRSVSVLSAGSVLGWLFWSLRSSYIVASFATSLNPGMMIDPLPILVVDEKKEKKSRKSRRAQPRKFARDQLEEMLKK